MERKEKNQISTLLLAVGVVFILIAGSIFVSTAWEYLPEAGKKMVLLVVTTGLLAGSMYLFHQQKLEKLEKALFYLGTGFAGYTMIALFGGISYGPLTLIWSADTIDSMEYVKIIVSSFVMLGLLGVRCLSRREGAALGLALILVDNCIWWSCIACGLYFKDFMIAEAILFAVYAVIDYIIGNSDEIQTECKKFYQIFLGFYVAHIGILFWGLLFRMAVAEYQIGEMSFYMLVFLLVSGLAYIRRPWSGLRIVNSFFILGVIYSVVADLFHSDLLKDWFCFIAPSLEETIMRRGLLTDWEMIALAFVISFSVVIWLRRRELLTAQVIIGQMLLLTQPYIEISQQFDAEYRYAVVIAGIVLLGRIWYDKWEVFRWIQFAIICKAFAGLLWNNLLHGELENVLILGVASLVILIVAAIYNKKEYVIASSITLCLLVFYLTRSFWLSLEWWMYLFVAGVALIVLAIRKER